MLTGESMPVDKRAGATVFAGTMNRSGSFRYEAKKVGRGTVLQQMIAVGEAGAGVACAGGPTGRYGERLLHLAVCWWRR